MFGWLLALLGIGGTAYVLSSSSDTKTPEAPPSKEPPRPPLGIVSTPAAIPGSYAAFYQQQKASGGLPFLSMVDVGGTDQTIPPDLNPNASVASMNAAFDQAQARSIAARKQSEQDAKAKLSDEQKKWVAALSAYLGPIGAGAGALWMTASQWALDAGAALSHLLYGDPGWNDPGQKERANRDMAIVLGLGYRPRPFSDDLDAGAEGYADRLEEQIAAIQNYASPAFKTLWNWAVANPNNLTVQNAIWLKLFPTYLGAIRSDKRVAATYAKLYAAMTGKNADALMQEAINAVQDVRTKPELRSIGWYTTSNEAAQGDAYVMNRIAAA